MHQCSGVIDVLDATGSDVCHWSDIRNWKLPPLFPHLVNRKGTSKPHFEDTYLSLIFARGLQIE